MFKLIERAVTNIYDSIPSIYERVSTKIVLSTIMILFVLSPAAFSIPTIDNVSVISVSDSQEGVIITGKEFGFNNNKQIEFIHDNIEAGLAGATFEKKSWVNYYTNKAIYTTDEKHSGSKSILFNFYGSLYGNAIIYDFGESVEEVFFTAWIKLDKNDDASTFQWKNMRLKNTNDYNIISGIYGDNWCYDSNTSPRWGNVSVLVMRNSVTDQMTKKTVEPDGFLLGEWQRIEAYYRTSSRAGADDGVFEWRRVGRSGGEVIVANYNIVTHDLTNADQLYRYLMIGHYYGNLKNVDGSSYTGIRNMRIYYDDIYISQSRARVEIGNNRIFSKCTHREVQAIQKWPPVINNSAVMIKINKGSFGSGTAYLFVVDTNGNPSEGFPITIK